MKMLPFSSTSEIEFSESYQSDFENNFKMKLPNELVEFLKKQNGGTIDGWFLDRYYVNHFFPLYDNRYGTISQTLEFLISEGVEKMIPFAGDNDSLTYCIAVGESGFSKIFGYQSGDWTPGENPLFHICDSFKEFLNSFKQEI
jgi:hypothetical protein